MHEVRRQELANRAATLAAAAQSLKRQSSATAPFSLAFLTDSARTPDPLQIADIMPPGTAVIFRHYEIESRASLAAALQQVCSARGLYLLIGADPALATEIGAAGVHFPGWFNAAGKRDPGLIYTAACHSSDDIAKAQAFGVDAALLSPAFPTASHPDQAALEPDAFRRLAGGASIPILALGGVTEHNAHRLAGANVAGFAAIGAFLG